MPTTSLGMAPDQSPVPTEIMRRSPPLIAAFTLALLVSVATAQDDWPQFRGPAGQARAHGSTAPLDWSETENVVWKTPLPGRGWSSPIVLGGQVWVTTAIETAATPQQRQERLADNEHADVLEVAGRISLRAISLDRNSGRVLHDVEVFNVENPDPIHQFNTYASPTPVAESGYVWVDFGTYGTACLETETGRVVWRRRFPMDHQVGPGSSPVVHQDLLLLARDGCDVQYVIGLDKRTGRTVWKTDRPPINLDYEFKKAFTTPLVVETSGGYQMIVSGAQWVVAYDPASGKPLWQVDYTLGYSNVPSPAFGAGMAYVATDGPGKQLWAIRADGRGDVTETHVAWVAKKQIPKRCSPLLVDDRLFLVTDTGVASCLDALSGEAIWQGRLQGNYSASPVWAAGRIYLVNDEGTTTVLADADEFTPLAENELEGRVVASPAFAGSAMFLRTHTHLYRIQQ